MSKTIDNLEDKSLDELYNEKIDLEITLKTINDKIKILEKEKIQNCKHDFIVEKEDCMYGTTFRYCKHCRVDYYNREIHY